MRKKPTKRSLVVRIDDDLRKKLDAAAFKGGERPVGSLVREILTSWANRAADPGHIAA